MAFLKSRWIHRLMTVDLHHYCTSQVCIVLNLDSLTPYDTVPCTNFGIMQGVVGVASSVEKLLSADKYGNSVVNLEYGFRAEAKTRLLTYFTKC